MPTQAQLEVYLDGAWHPAGAVALTAPIREAPATETQGTRLDYDFDYALDRLGQRGLAAFSLRHPVSLDATSLEHFPAFTLDLLPQGPARAQLHARLRRGGEPINDWTALLHGANSPVGNLRVRPPNPPSEVTPRGVPEALILDRGEDFLAWAEENGIPTRGASDSGGASPKLLLTQDAEGLYHADGALPDALACKHWLIKFPRGTSKWHDHVLACEAPFLEFARRVGLRCAEPLRHQDRALFVPRFDREVKKQGVQRLGMESVYSLMGVPRHGAELRWEAVCEAIAKVVDDPPADIEELVVRDALSQALGNTDNHGRNTSLLKRPGSVQVSPLYDFAPMCLDPDLVPRMTRWRSEREPRGLRWAEVVDAVKTWVPAGPLIERLLRLAEDLELALPFLEAEGIAPEVRARLTPHLTRTQRALRSLEA